MIKWAAAGILALCINGPLWAAPVTVRAISAFPANFEFTKQFQNFVDRVNKEGEGIIKIQFVGGPEVIPAQQQDTAIRNGVIDMQMGPATYYNGIVPEADALYGANINPIEARKNGALALLNKIWRKKLNAEFLAWQSGDIPFYIYLTKKPKMAPNGDIDLDGTQIRVTSAYREWITALGGSNVVLPATDVFTAMERGVVGGLVWPALGFTDLGVYKFTKYRVGPPVWQLDFVIMMNGDKWDKLPQAAKTALERAAAEHEIDTQTRFGESRAKEEAILKKAGVQDIDVSNPQLHEKVAHDLVWQRLTDRDPTNVSALRELMYKTAQ